MTLILEQLLIAIAKVLDNQMLKYYAKDLFDYISAFKKENSKQLIKANSQFFLQLTSNSDFMLWAVNSKVNLFTINKKNNFSGFMTLEMH
jgi:hypothetical protein